MPDPLGPRRREELPLGDGEIRGADRFHQAEVLPDPGEPDHRAGAPSDASPDRAPTRRTTQKRMTVRATNRVEATAAMGVISTRIDLPHLDRERLGADPGQEDGDDDLVERRDEREHGAADHSRQDQGQGHGAKSMPGGGAQPRRRPWEHGIEAME